MIFVSFTDASRHLGIDAKTLHRWLAEAELPLQPHPHDGRKKGVSQEHLQMLARQHHRHLDGDEEPVPAQLADWLKLPEQLSVMHAQLITLQQQVADLSRLLTQHQPEPAPALPPAQPTTTLKQSAKPTRSRPAAPRAAKAKTPAKPVHVIARVEYDQQGHYVVICPKRGVLPIRPDTEEWFAWVREQESFRFVGKGGYFTAHHWWRVPRGAWRAHRHIRNRVHSLRLAPNHELTIAVLEQAAEVLQALLV